MIPLASETASCQIDALKATVFATYGAPEMIICDRHTAYNSALFREFYFFYGIELAIGGGYSRNHNAIVDRFHRSIKQIVRKSIEKLEDWPSTIHDIVAVYNATRHASTGFAPSYLLAGIHPRLPIDAALQYKPRIELIDYPSVVARDLAMLATATEVATENLKKREEAQLFAFRKRHANTGEPKIGDIVYRLSIDWKFRRKSPKLDPIRYYGPYKITALMHPHCELETLDGLKVPTRVHLAEIHPANGKKGAPIYPAEEAAQNKSSAKETGRESKHIIRPTRNLRNKMATRTDRDKEQTKGVEKQREIEAHKNERAERHTSRDKTNVRETAVYRYDRHRSNTRMEWRHTQVTCRRCRRKGHIENNCRMKMRADETKRCWNDGNRHREHEQEQYIRRHSPERTQTYAISCDQMGNIIGAIVERLAQQPQTNNGRCDTYDRGPRPWMNRSWEQMPCE